MSRSFIPPDTLSKDDVEKLGAVRRSVWLDGFYGMGLGSVSGLLLHTSICFVGRYRKLPFTLNRNTAMAWFLGGGALGSLILSTVRGKNEVHKLHDVFERGAIKPLPEESTEEQLRRVREELKHREENRLYRRTTIQNALNRGKGGPSDAGGHWVEERDNEKP